MFDVFQSAPFSVLDITQIFKSWSRWLYSHVPDSRRNMALEDDLKGRAPTLGTQPTPSPSFYETRLPYYLNSMTLGMYKENAESYQ